ncbi:MAG: hypothetical protein CMD74_03140 [Gammaproteobacteria bacterium]|nr:hypothetical protein [Gammaproteobacteria bacterium]
MFDDVRILLIILVLGFAGCASFNDDEGIFVNKADDYMDATDQEALIIPPDLSHERIQDPFPIPANDNQVNPAFYPGRPPQPRAMYANDARDEVRIQRLGGRRWLAVPESPDGVWPKVKQFLAENGVEIVEELGSEGRLNSAWMQIENQNYRDVVRTVMRDVRESSTINGGWDRILVRIERGMRERTAEVHLRHQFTPAKDAPVLSGNVLVDISKIKSSLDGIEADILSEIGAFIAAKVSEQTVSMIAQGISLGAKSEVVRNDSGIPTLRFYLDRSRAWAAIGQALDRAEVEIKSSDSETGKYFVAIGDSFLIADEGRGFFRRLLGSGARKKMATTDDLQIVMEEITDSIFSVFILDENDQHINRESSQDLLVMIREFAS